MNDREKSIVKRLDDWVTAAASREKFSEPVFEKRPNIAKLISEICGISLTTSLSSET